MESYSQSGSLIAERYRLEERLGEGGMGVVWRASRLDGGDPVAIKVLKNVSATATPARFMREARAASMVSHPNVVVVHEVVRVDERPAIVMELLHGETLSQRLAGSRRLAEDETASLLIRVAAAVGAAHERGIVHRDLKPANIFVLAEEPVVKVLDFGLAKWTKAASGSAETMGTASGALLGTPCYMSPEQAFGERDLDHRADLWSLGIIAYECLSGVLPTRAENIGQVLKIVLQGKILPLGEVVPGVSPGLAALVDDLLELEREDRPPDMRDVITRLSPFTSVRVPAIGPPLRRPASAGVMGDRPTSDVTTIDPEGSEVRVAVPSVAPAFPPVGPARGWRKRWAAGVVVVGALGAAAYAANGSQRAATPERIASALAPAPQPIRHHSVSEPSPSSVGEAIVEPVSTTLSPPAPSEAPRAARKPVSPPAPRPADAWPSEFEP